MVRKVFRAGWLSSFEIHTTPSSHAFGGFPKQIFSNSLISNCFRIFAVRNVLGGREKASEYFEFSRGHFPANVATYVSSYVCSLNIPGKPFQATQVEEVQSCLFFGPLSSSCVISFDPVWGSWSLQRWKDR